MSEVFIKNAKAVLNKLGIKAAELEKEDAKIDDISSKVIAGIVENNSGDLVVEAEKNAAAAAYKKLEKQLVKAFGLDAEKYKALEKGQLDAMLKDAAAKAESAAADDAPKDKASGDAAALQSKLAELEKMHKAAVAERDKFKADLEGMPTKIAQREREVRIDYERKAHIAETLKELRTKGVKPQFTDKMLLAELFGEDVDLEVVDSNGKVQFRPAQKTQKEDGTFEYKPLKKSASEAYGSLGEYAMDKVIKEEWLEKSKPAANTTYGTANPTGDAAKIDTSKLPPALIKSLGL